MAEEEEISYTPEELQEIERIVELVGSGGQRGAGAKAPPAAGSKWRETAVLPVSEEIGRAHV